MVHTISSLNHQLEEFQRINKKLVTENVSLISHFFIILQILPLFNYIGKV
jgi:hypothetical protein